LGSNLLDIIQKEEVFKMKKNGFTLAEVLITLGIVGVIAAIGPALVAFGKVATGISAIMKTAEMLKGFIDLSMLGPAGIIMLIIGALILLYTKCEWFRDAVDAVIQAVVDFFTNAMDGIINFFTKTLPDTFNAVIQFVQDNWQGLLLLLVNPFVGAFKLVYDNSEEFRNFIDNLVNSVIDFFTQLPEKATKWGKDMIDNFVNGITEKVSKLWNTVKDIGKGIADYLGFSVPDKGPLSDADKWMPDMIDLLTNGINKEKDKLLSAVNSLAEDMSVPMINSEVSRTLMASNNITMDVSMTANLDGRQVANSVENRITKKINSRNAFKGA
jgi:prepilin-type N-terminal cleavage/methylation domain-containing protein